MKEKKELFEEWAGLNGFHMSKSIHKDYEESKLNWMWKAWKEARKPNWISVEDRLPEPWADVLTYESSGDYGICEYNPKSKTFIRVENGSLLLVTHWQPLPTPPKA